jgi:ADP-L-glycero-D-manno-heptose 6-epimerase
MILITGGAGFIGSVLAATLNLHGRDDLIIVDQLDSTSKWMNLRGLRYQEYLESKDLLSSPNNILDKVEFIFHLGACSSTTEMNMAYLMENNVNYSKSLFNIAVTRDIPIVYASSAATYGAGEHGYSEDLATLNLLRPLNPYGYSKQVFDQWVVALDRRPRHWFGLKFFNVFGPQEYHKGEMRSLVHKAYEQILETGRVKLFRSHRSDFQDGQQLRDFVYVKDVVKLMIEMMNPSAQHFSGLYNCGTGTARSFSDLVTSTFKAMEREVAIDFIDMPLEIRDQYQYFTEAKMDKLHKFLPTFEFMPLELAVQDYVKQHLMENPYF